MNLVVVKQEAHDYVRATVLLHQRTHAHTYTHQRYTHQRKTADDKRKAYGIGLPLVICGPFLGLRVKLHLDLVPVTYQSHTSHIPVTYQSQTSHKPSHKPPDTNKNLLKKARPLKELKFFRNIENFNYFQKARRF